MEYKKAIGVLLEMMERSNNPEEKEALLTAIGTLDCGSLADNRLKGIMKSRKEKKDDDAK